MFTHYTSENELVTKMYKEHLHINNKNNPTITNGRKVLIDSTQK